MKKTIISTVFASLLLSGASVFADTRANDDVRIPFAPEINMVSSVNEPRENLANKSLERMKARGMQLIKERVNALTSNKTAITQNKSLTTEQKTALSAIIDTNVTGLTALKVTIASSTDATSTKALVDSVFTNFRIYGIVIPQVRLERRIYDLQNHSVKLSDTFLKVQAKIDEYKGKGRDVTVWQKSLDDAKVKVALDMNILATSLTKVAALKPSDYGTSSKMVIDAVNTDLKNVAKDFNSIAKTLHKPAVLKNYVGASTTPKVIREDSHENHH